MQASSSSPLTVSQVSCVIRQRFKTHIPAWKIRRAVDQCDDKVPRAGLYRLIDADLLARVVASLQASGWLPSELPEIPSTKDNCPLPGCAAADGLSTPNATAEGDR